MLSTHSLGHDDASEESSCDVSSSTDQLVSITNIPCSSQGSQSGSQKKYVNRGRWSKSEDEKLKIVVQKLGEGNWSLVSAQFPDRSDVQCQQRWDKVVNPSLIKGPWTKEVRDSEKLLRVISSYTMTKSCDRRMTKLLSWWLNSVPRSGQ